MTKPAKISIYNTCNKIFELKKRKKKTQKLKKGNPPTKIGNVRGKK